MHSSPEEAFELAKKINKYHQSLIGGGEIYNYFLDKDLVNVMWITKIHDSFDADVYFPQVDWEKDWDLIDNSEIKHHEKTGLDYSFETYVKKGLKHTLDTSVRKLKEFS